MAITDYIREASAPTGFEFRGTPGYEIRMPDGTWKKLGSSAEHQESLSYINRALSDPNVEALFKFAYENPQALNREQQAFMRAPVESLDSYGQGSRWGMNDLFDNAFTPQYAGTLINYGNDAGVLTPQERQQGAHFNWYESPAQQSARSDDGGLFGDLAPIISLAALAYGGYGLLNGLGALGGTTASSALAAEAAAMAEAGFTSAEIASSLAGLGADAGSIMSAAGLGGTAAAGGSNMGLFDSIGNFFSDPVSSIGNLFDSGGSGMWGSDMSIGDIGNYLGDQVASGAITSDEAMAAMQAYNNAASGGTWGSFLADAPLTGLAEGATAAGVSPTNLFNSVKSMFSGAPSGLLGAGAGALLGSVGGAKQAGTTSTTVTPWAGQQPYLLDAFAKAKSAADGSPLQTQAVTNYQSVLSGPTKNPYLGMDNPYLTTAIDNANADVTRAMMPAMNYAERASGSFGNSGIADAFGKSMTDAYSRNANTMRMQDYTNQQNLAQQDVNNRLGFTTGANTFAAQPAQSYAQTIQGNYGGTTTTPYYNNPMSNMLGGGLLGYNLFK